MTKVAMRSLSSDIAVTADDEVKLLAAAYEDDATVRMNDTLDAEGGVWVALYDGGAVHRTGPTGTSQRG